MVIESPAAAMSQAPVTESSVVLPPESPGEHTMAATLHFFCPTTHQQVPTGIKTDVQGLRASWRSTVSVDCKHCGQVHEISVRDAYLSGALIAAAMDRAAIAMPRRGGILG
jgi:hypothetical protein